MQTGKRQLWGACAAVVFLIWMALVLRGWETASASIFFDAPERSPEPAAAAPEEGSGGIRLLKTDIKGNPLAGARYRLLREATEEELLDPKVRKEWIRGEIGWLLAVEVPFRNGSGSETSETTVATGAEGTAGFWGLPYGTYYIQETQTPAGFDPQENPLVARVDAQSGTAASAAILVVTTRTPQSRERIWDLALLAAAVLAVVSATAALVLLKVCPKIPDPFRDLP